MSAFTERPPDEESTVYFEAEVDESGKPKVVNLEAWKAKLSEFKGARILLGIARFFRRRTSLQNRWYWGCIVKMVGQYLSRGRETALSKDQVHYILKSSFLGSDEVLMDGRLVLVPMGSAKLTTAQFSTYCEEIRAHAASEWGLDIPDPETWERQGEAA